MTEREYFDAVEKIINKALAAGMTLDEICKKLEIDTHLPLACGTLATIGSFFKTRVSNSSN